MANIAFSSWINAWTIEKALKPLGRDLSVTQDRGLVRQVVAGPTSGDTLFFTQEDSMYQFLCRDDLQFQPRDLPAPGRDDKLAFAEFAEDLGVPTVPSRPINGFKEEPDRKILLKARHSWRKGRQLPRGAVWPPVRLRGLPQAGGSHDEPLSDLPHADHQAPAGLRGGHGLLLAGPQLLA